MMHKIYVRKSPSRASICSNAMPKLKFGKELPPPRDILRKEIREVDGILTLLTDRIDKKFWGAAKNLKVIGNYAVGFDNIDIDEATRRGIVVTNTPEFLRKQLPIWLLP